jgi:hypothetical protein
MFQVKQNESTASRKRLPILLVDATDGFTPETGVTSPTISISKNGATAASGTGSFVEIGFGQYYYEFASGEIDTLGWTAVYVIKTGTTRAYNAIVQIMAYDYAVSTNLGLSSLPTAAIGATGALLTSYTSNGALGLSSTGAVSNVANVASGLSDADTAGLRYRLGLDGTATAPSATGNLGANSGSVANVSGNIVGNLLGSVTGDVQGNVDGTVNSVTFLNGSALAQIWDWASASIGATNSIGYQLKINIDEPISSIDQSVWNYDISGIGATNLAGGALEAAASGTGSGTGSSAEFAMAVWDYDVTGYNSDTRAGDRLLNQPKFVWEVDLTTLSIGDNWQAGNRLTEIYFSVYDPNIPGQIIGQNVWNYDTSVMSPASLAGGYLNDINSITQFLNNNYYDVNAISSGVWTFDPTGYELPYAAGLLFNAATGASVAAVANEVWSTDISGYTSPSAGYDLANVSAGSGGSSAVEIAEAVWQANVVGVGGTTSAAVYLTETLFTTGNIESYVANQTPQDIWTYSGLEGRTVTGGTGVTITQAFPANFADLAITSSTGLVTTSNPGVGSTATPVQVAAAVWGYNTGTGASAAAQINSAAIGDSAASAKAVWDTNLLPYFVAGPSDIAGRVVYETKSQTDQIPQNIFDYDAGPYKTDGYTNFGGVIWAAAIGASAAQNVWTYNTGTGASAAAQLNAAAIAGSGGSSASEVAQAVWGYNTGTGASAAAQLNSAAVAGSGGSTGIEVAQAVWDYTNLYNAGYPAGQWLTGLIPDAIATTINQTIDIGGEVWSNNIVNISGAPLYSPSTAGGYLYNTASGISATSALSIAQNVWNYNTGTGASAAAQLNAAAIAGSGGSSAIQVAEEVWGYVTRDITGGTIDTNNDKTGYTLTQTFPPNFEDLSITSTTGLVTITNPGTGSTATPQDVAIAVWEADPAYHNNNSTFGKAILRSDNSNITGSVTMWSGASYNGVMADAYRIDESYDAAINLKNVLTGIGATVTGNIVGSVDTVVNDVNVSAGSIADIADSTWSEDISGYTSPSAGYDLANVTAGSGGSSGVEIAQAVWAYDISTGPASPAAAHYIDNINTNASSAATDASTAASNTNDIGGTVWSYDPTALTVPQAGAILTDIQSDTNTIISDIGNVPNNVWASDVSGYSTPGEAGFELYNAGSGGSSSVEIAGEVWSYATRNITGGEIDTNNDKTGYSLTQSFPTNFEDLSITATTGLVTTSNPGTGSTATPQDVAAATWGYGSGRTITGGIGVTLATSLPSNISTLNIDGTGKVSVQSADITTIKSGLSTLTQAQVGTEVDSSLSDVGLTSTVTGRIDTAISSRLASASVPANFADLSITASTGLVTTSNPGTGSTATVQQVAAAVWTANRASIGASDGQFGYYLNAPVSAAGGTVTQVMLGPFSLAATDGNNGYLNVFVDDERPVELVISDQNGNAIPLDSNNTHSVLVYDSGSTLVATYTGTVEYEAGGIVSFPLDADVTGTAGSYRVVFDIDNGLTISKYGGLTILVRLC